jgi:acyl-CoA dehydrogenase
MNDAGSWELPEELRMLRDTIRRFMAEEVKPVEDKLPHDAYTPEAADLERLQKKARDLGLWCFETPAEHGGAGLSLLGSVLLPKKPPSAAWAPTSPAAEPSASIRRW